MSVPSCSSLLSVFRRIRAAPVLTVLALALVAAGVMTGAASARDTLRRGEALYRGDQLTSGSGEYLLEFPETGGPRWSQSCKAHYRFCKSGVPPEILFAEHDARVGYLRGHAPKGNSAFEDLLAASLAAILAEIANGNTSSR